MLPQGLQGWEERAAVGRPVCSLGHAPRWTRDPGGRYSLEHLAPRGAMEGRLAGLHMAARGEGAVA